MYHKYICKLCNAHLDPGEHCDCTDERDKPAPSMCAQT
jgi:hypothetical protein